MCREVLEDFAADNVQYLELRTTPRALDDADAEGYIRVVIRELEEFQFKPGNTMRVRLLLVLLVGITRFVVELVFFYTTVMNEPDIAPDARFRVFWSAARAHVQLRLGRAALLQALSQRSARMTPVLPPPNFSITPTLASSPSALPPSFCLSVGSQPWPKALPVLVKPGSITSVAASAGSGR